MSLMDKAPDQSRQFAAGLGFPPIIPRLERFTPGSVVFQNDRRGRPRPFPLERQMSKRKPATTSKRARGPKVAARAQRNKQAVVRSPKDSPRRSVAAGPTESPVNLHDDSKREAPLVESPAAALQDDFDEKIGNNNPTKGLDFSLATANVQAYQAKLLEIAQANIQFAFEFGPRLATIRSPFEFFALIAEFTSRRIDMLQKHSKEMAAYSFWRINTSRELAAMPGQ
jgi:Phasin protein